jgi:autotransporter-associated beta strand protein
VNFNGGILQATSALAGTFANPVNIINGPLVGRTLSGTGSMVWSGVVTVTGQSRSLANNLSGGAELTISNSLVQTEAGTGRIMVLLGSGTTNITGVVSTTATGGSLYYLGSGTLNLTGTNTITGDLRVEGGTVNLRGSAGSVNLISTTAGSGLNIRSGAVVNLDSSGALKASGRIAGRAVTLQGGTLSVISNASATTETAGPLQLYYSKSAISLTGVGANTLTFASLAYASVNSATNTAVLDVSGSSALGSTNKLLFTTAPTAVGGILPRVFISGTDFAKYDVSLGVMAFSAYAAGTDVNTAATTDTVKVTAAYATDDFTASKTLNALAITDSTARTVALPANSMLTLSSGGLLVGGGVTHVLSATRLGFGTDGYIQVASGSTLDLQGSIISSTFTKGLGGTLIVSARQYSAGVINIADGTVQLNTPLNAFPATSGFNVEKGATFDLNGNTLLVQGLFTQGSVANAAGTITSTTGVGTFVFNNSGFNTYFGGTVSGASVNFARVGGYTVTLGGPLNQGGATAFLGGTTILQEAATLLNTSAITLNYAVVNITNNVNVLAQNNNLISDTAPLTMRGASLGYAGYYGSAATETFGALTLAQGDNNLTATLGGGTISSVDLTFGSLSRGAGATINFAGYQSGSGR